MLYSLFDYHLCCFNALLYFTLLYYVLISLTLFCCVLLCSSLSSLFSPLSPIFYPKWRKPLRSQRSEQRRISPMPMASHVKSTVSTHISVYTYVSTCHGRILFRRRLLFMLWHQSTSVSRKFLISTPFFRLIRYYKITMLHLSSEMILQW